MNRKRKRFIAGGVCPKCHSMDTLAILYEEQGEKMECVKCGYHEYQKNDADLKSNQDPKSIIGRFSLK
ncbi:YheV family putative zinc ribbon protein [Candidatus Hamiltonella defensa]|uniref:YheV family putative zinc ribbon protein n=1 Tax=Candidatus Williamhamiltonella defendens TaxID=138072 RepID=UPI001581FE9A|nr:YheV family putative zinc ribbon protein [Candidatus Hamiltonella defensa]